MPKRPKTPSPIHQPMLFPDAVSLVRINPEKNEWRFYRMDVWPDLFGRALLMRQWGRIGTEGNWRLDAHPDPGAAVDALMTLLRSKRNRGYVDRSV